MIKHRGKPAQVWGGVSGFRILKTKRSSHVGFYKDQYTTLEGRVDGMYQCMYFTPIIPDEPDRMLSTVVESSWKFNDGTAALYNGAMYTAVYNSAIRSIMDEFFGPAEEGKIHINCGYC